MIRANPHGSQTRCAAFKCIGPGSLNKGRGTAPELVRAAHVRTRFGPPQFHHLPHVWQRSMSVTARPCPRSVPAVHREALRLPAPEIVGQLVCMIGRKLTAYAGCQGRARRRSVDEGERSLRRRRTASEVRLPSGPDARRKGRSDCNPILADRSEP